MGMSMKRKTTSTYSTRNVRRRFSGSRRFRRSKWRNISRRRPVDKFSSSILVNQGGVNYKRKRKVPYSVYRRRLFNASTAAQKYRTNNTGNVVSLATTADNTQFNVFFQALVLDAGSGLRFWQPAGGLVTGNETPSTTDFGGSDLFLRGGTCRLNLSNTGVNSTRVVTWRGRTTINGGVPANPFSTPQGWDPSLPNPALLATDPERDVWKNFRFWGAREVILKPGESFERVEVVRAQKIDQDQWINNRNRDIWIIAVQNQSTDAVNIITETSSYNLAFTGDRVI